MSGVAPVLLALAVVFAPATAPAQVDGRPLAVRTARGHVVSVDPAQRLVLLKHDAIPSLGMPEMVMEYAVPEGAAFPDLAPGDKVRFGLVRIEGRYVVIRVAPLATAAGRGRKRAAGAARSDP